MTNKREKITKDSVSRRKKTMYIKYENSVQDFKNTNTNCLGLEMNYK